ncbi:MAG TPA: restriction endonuclease subunit S [Alphaproteobacteria bacterium]|nr:restriction endonuclease subunit S [Alphaproteobacteria bacterium]
MSKATMKRYDAYKDSGVEWLGEVPEHWEVKRVKDLSRLQSGDSIVSEQIEEKGKYPVYGGNGLRGYYSKYTNNGEYILIGRQGALCGNINYASGKFWASEHAVVAYLKQSIDMKWYGEMLRIMNLNQYSLAAAQPGLAMDRIKRLLLPVPPFPEQTAIAAYLDIKTAQLDRKIDLLTQKATQYGKLKQSLINETVTRGLDKSVAMKDSGVEWIGEVPEHWDVKRFKEIFNKTHTGWTPDTNKRECFEGDNIWVTIRDMSNSHVSDSLNKLSDKAINEAGIPITPKGSLLFSFKLSIGKIAFSECDLYTNEAIISIEDEININLNYFYYTLPIFLILNAKENIYGAKLLNQSLIFNTLLLSPPKGEQKAIADYLDTKTTHVDRIVETINTQIEKLKELRKTMINDVVTGKIKVAK